MLPRELCHLKSIFNLSDLPRNVIFPTAKLTQSLLLTFCDEIYITKKYFRERCSSLVATLAAPTPTPSMNACEFHKSLRYLPSSAFTSILIPHFIWKSGWQLWLLSFLCVFVFAPSILNSIHLFLESGGARGRQVELIVGIAWGFMLSYSNLLFSKKHHLGTFLPKWNALHVIS